MDQISCNILTVLIVCFTVMEHITFNFLRKIYNLLILL